MDISKPLVLRSGYAVLIGLLLLSTFMAFRIQEGFSEKSVEIHRRYVVEQETLTNLRRTLFNAAIALRDHFINPRPDEAAFAGRLAAYRRDSDALLGQLHSTTPTKVTEMRAQFNGLWKAVEKAASADWDPTQKYAYVQEEIVPRRDALGALLREIEKANHASLAESDKEFGDTRKAATSRLMILLAACVICGMAVVAVSLRYSTTLEGQAAQRFNEVLAAKRELEELSARLMEVQEEERTRLSRELHDEIVQNLAVMKMEIAAAQVATAGGPARAREPLARARRIAESTVQAVRNISLLLRPSLLDDLGLSPALQWQAEEFSRRTGVPCEFVDSLSDSDPQLPDAVKTCVYRVAQEALRNCEKHSKATAVCLSLSMDASGALDLSIADNGVGFRAQAHREPTQLGLLGMRERALALGGALTATNKPGGGAVVRLRIPGQGRHPAAAEGAAARARAS